MVNNVNGMFYATTYHPIQAGSIDGTDITAHDNGVYRALLASATGLYDPLGDPKVEGDPYCSLFVGRLSAQTDENSLRQGMSKYGRVKNLRLVRHIVTGASCGYAFVEFESEKDMRVAYEEAHLSKLDGACILVDYNRQQLMSGWIPRRLGGGLGGKKESGQLRFGGRDRPFRAPLRPIPHEELRKLGIPLPPEGRYMTWFQVPPIPRRQSTTSEYDGSSKTKQHRGEEYELTVKEKNASEAEEARERDRHRRHRDEFSDRKHRIDPESSSKYEGYYEVKPKRPDSRDEQKRKHRREESLEYDDEDRKRHRSERRNRNLEYHTEQRDPDPEPSSRSSRRNAEIDVRHRDSSRYRSEDESEKKHRHGEPKDESDKKHRYGESEKKHRHGESKDESHEKKHRHGESKHRHSESKHRQRDREEGSPSHEDHESKHHKKHKRSAGEEKKRSRHRERDV